MNITQSLEIIRSLADGVNPYTGKQFKAISAYQKPDTIRALHIAICALEKVHKNEVRQKNLPINNGMIWELSEVNKLIKAFDAEIPIKKIASNHQRTEGAIRARLVHLGKIEE